jgi:hypothetical protein
VQSNTTRIRQLEDERSVSQAAVKRAIADSMNELENRYTETLIQYYGRLLWISSEIHKCDASLFSSSLKIAACHHCRSMPLGIAPVPLSDLGSFDLPQCARRGRVKFNPH